MRREGIAAGIVVAVRGQAQRRRRTVESRGKRRFEIGKRSEIASLSSFLAGDREQRHAGTGARDRHIRSQRLNIDVLRIHLNLVVAADGRVLDIEIQISCAERFEWFGRAGVAPVDIQFRADRSAGVVWTIVVPVPIAVAITVALAIIATAATIAVAHAIVIAGSAAIAIAHATVVAAPIAIAIALAIVAAAAATIAGAHAIVATGTAAIAIAHAIVVAAPVAIAIALTTVATAAAAIGVAHAIVATRAAAVAVALTTVVAVAIVDPHRQRGDRDGLEVRRTGAEGVDEAQADDQLTDG